MIIRKYTMIGAPTEIISMPTNAVILTVADQHGSTVMWAVIDPTAICQPRTFCMFTDNNWIEVTPKHIYIATVLALGGGVAFHVFELKA